MSEENNVNETKCNCFCHSKGFRKFLVVATGTFVGVYSALSLFAAIHRPPMPVPCPCGCPMMRPPMAHPMHMDKFDRASKGEFKVMKHKMDKKMPVRVEIDED